MSMWTAEHLKALVAQVLARRQSWLVDYQKNALKQFLKLGFPKKNQPAWKYTSTKIIEDNAFKFFDFPKNISSITDIDTDGKFYNIVFLNGYYIEQLSANKILKEKHITVSSITQSSSINKTFIKKAFDFIELLKINDLPFYYLALALLIDGIHIHVPRNTKLDKPIRLLHLTTDEFSFHMRHAFCILQLDENSETVFIEEVKDEKSHLSLSNYVTQIFLDKHAVMHHYNIQPHLTSAIHIHQLLVQQTTASNYRHYDVTKGAGRLLRNDRRIYLKGNDAKASLKGVFSVDATHHADHYIHINHLHANTHSKQLYKGLAKDDAHATFNSHVLIPAHIQKATASQLTQNLLLSNDAEIDLSPTLEIYSDDVQCSHGATIGALDEKALFYLCSRGIDRDAAEKLLQKGFLMEVIETIPHLICRAVASDLIAHSIFFN